MNNTTPAQPLTQRLALIGRASLRSPAPELAALIAAHTPVRRVAA